MSHILQWLAAGVMILMLTILAIIGTIFTFVTGSFFLALGAGVATFLAMGVIVHGWWECRSSTKK